MSEVDTRWQQALAIHRLDPADLRLWLQALPPKTHAGDSQEPDSCVLANYLRQNGIRARVHSGGAVSVLRENKRHPADALYPADDLLYYAGRLPDWAIRFFRSLDDQAHEYGSVTRECALTTLREVEQ